MHRKGQAVWERQRMGTNRLCCSKRWKISHGRYEDTSSEVPQVRRYSKAQHDRGRAREPTETARKGEDSTGGLRKVGPAGPLRSSESLGGARRPARFAG